MGFLWRNKRALSALPYQVAVALWVSTLVDDRLVVLYWFAGAQALLSGTALLILYRQRQAELARPMEVLTVWLLPILVSSVVFFVLTQTGGTVNVELPDGGKLMQYGIVAALAHFWVLLLSGPDGRRYGKEPPPREPFEPV